MESGAQPWLYEELSDGGRLDGADLERGVPRVVHHVDSAGAPPHHRLRLEPHQVSEERSLPAVDVFPLANQRRCCRLSLMLLTQWDGQLTVWDLLRRQHEPVVTMQVCEEPLTRVRAHEAVSNNIIVSHLD